MTVQLGPHPQTPCPQGLINLGLGQPDPGLLPLAELRRAAQQALGPDQDPLLLQYGVIAGYAGFRQALAFFLSQRYRFDVDAEQLMASGGASLSLGLAAQVLARPGDTVVCEDPSYFLAPGIFRQCGLRVRSVPIDAQGLRTDLLERELVAGLRPAFVYCIPSFHNPSGVTLAPERAERLVELAERYDLSILADEPYVLLHFGPRPPACMMAYDHGRARVLSVGTFSKILAPGLRCGWLHAHPRLLERVAQHGVLRSGGALNPVICALVERALRSGFLARHVDELRATYAERAQAMHGALRRHLSAAAPEEPRGGYFSWMKISQPTEELLPRALERGVGFTPGARCAIERDLGCWLRLCFAFHTPAEIREGVRRLAAMLR